MKYELKKIKKEKNSVCIEELYENERRKISNIDVQAAASLYKLRMCCEC
jgi:predicted CopG family antitoxin